MVKFLANENVPLDVIDAARQAGHDVASIHELSPGAADEEVLRLSLAGQRVLVTFDKDFGKLAFESGQRAACGVVLLRPRLRSPEYLTRFVLGMLSQDVDWIGHFTVAQETRIRVVALPH